MVILGVPCGTQADAVKDDSGLELEVDPQREDSPKRREAESDTKLQLLQRTSNAVHGAQCG